ncbi:MAG: protein BatD [Gammaproteobacteria bacterium]|nr:protein BatD [Gammaproteobacteria bacterium]
MVKRFSLLKLLICLVLPVGFSQIASAADIIVSTDRANIGLNESFTLIFETTGSVDDDPDFTPLQEDFDILNTQQSSNISVVNGSMTRNQTWTLRLFPKRDGKITIPEIQFGQDKSPALPITISKQTGSSNTGKADKDIFIETSLEPKSAYLQQQVIYTIKLYRAVVTNNASLTDPEINSTDAVSLKLGEDRNYDTVVGGRRYSVFERKYALFPQKAGTLKIPPIQFTGTISDMRRGLFDFDPFGRGGKMLRELSNAVELEVKPVPAEFKGRHWLPAQSVQLSESWSPNPPVFTVGEPVTRSITLAAVGLTAAQLPELKLNIPVDLKQYPDQPNLQDTSDGHNTVGTRIEKLALIPTRPGRYTLPAVEVPWWNIKTQKQEMARLPARTIDVAPAANMPSTPPSETTSAETATTERPTQTATSSTNGFWFWISLLLALGWIITLILWWQQSLQQRKLAKDKPAATAKPDPAVALKQLRVACRDNQPQTAKQALLKWAQARWPEGGMHNLDAVASKTGGELENQIRQLNARLYQQSEAEWQGDNLWRVIEGWQSPDELNRSADNAALEPLHKIRTE